MKKRKIFTLLLALSFLASCGENKTDNNDNNDDNNNTDDNGYNITYYEYEDEENPTFNWDKGDTLSFNQISDYSIGSSSNLESYDYDNIIVKTPTNKLSDDFMYAFDISSAYSVMHYGGKFFNKDGKEEDLFNIIKDAGATHVRLRIWNDPYDLKGNSYGGGENDLSTTIYLAKKAESVGLKVFLDFHYSDSWADPSKQYNPKSWKNVMLRNRYQAVGDYTGRVLNTLKSEGIEVDAVQIGNETNNGMSGMSPTSKFVAYSIKAGVTTAKSIYPNIKTYIHLTNVTNYSSITQFLDNLVKWDSDIYDAVGLSYYPYWHGSKDNLLNVMNDIVSTYNKEVAVVETSWGFTDESAPYSSNQYSTESCSEEGGYKTSIQAQASEIADVVDTLSKVDNNKAIGISYWEPAWLSLEGCGWITKYGAYYNDNGTDWTESSASLSSYTDQYCKSSWANQALFSYTGKALPSLYTYKYLQDGSKDISDDDIKIEGLVSSKFSGSYDMKKDELNLPSTGQVYDNLDRFSDVDIKWNEIEVSSLKEKEAGTYEISGTCGGYEVSCTVKVSYNYIDDYSFENQNTLQNDSSNEYALTSPWELEASTSGVRVETKGEGNVTGTHYFHWWSSSAFTFTLSQKLVGVKAGTYKLETYVLTHTASEYGGYTDIGLFYQIGDGEVVKVSMKSKCAGYSAGPTLWSVSNIENIESNDNGTITIGMYAECGATTWGHNDDWSFTLA